VARGEA
jgi:hypothetical protein